MNTVFASIRRTPYQSLASFLILFFTLFLMACIFVSISFLHGLLNYVETRPQVIVYFQTRTSEEDIFRIRDELMSSGKVTEIIYVSQDEAYNLHKEFTQDTSLLIEMTSADILPASLEIYATKPEYLAEIAEFLQTQPGVDEVQFQEVVVDRLLSLTRAVRTAAFLLFSFLLFMTIVVIITTISFKIALKKDEIEILKLLGASNFYIKKPFLIEAMTIGVLAALAAGSALFAVLISINAPLSAFLAGIPTLKVAFFSQYVYAVWPLNPIFLSLTYGLTTLFGIVISFIGSYLATKKYL